MNDAHVASQRASERGTGRALWLPALLLPLAAALGLLLGSGRPVIPPSQLAGALTILLVGVATSSRRASSSRAVGLLVVAASALGAGWVMTRPGLPNGHDVLHHVWGLYGFGESVRAGDLFPRWIHHVGLGMPLLQFYPPGTFYMALPVVLLGLAPATTLKATLVFFSALAGLAMYRVARAQLSENAALIAAVAYVWAPYALFDRHYRVALAEVAALVVAPLAMHAALRALRHPGSRSLASAGAWFCLLVVTHPLSSVMVATGLAIWVLVEWWPGPNFPGGLFSCFARLGTIAALATLLGAFYLLPVAAESRYTSIGDAVADDDGPTVAQHGLRLRQLLEPRRWDRWQRSQPAGTEADLAGDEPPFYFGLVLLATLPITLAVRKRQTTALVLMTVGALLLTLRPLAELLALAPWWRLLQFPWRFELLATVGAAWSAGFATQTLTQKLRAIPAATMLARWVPSILVALLVLDAFPYTGAPSWYAPYRGLATQAYDPDACHRGDNCWRVHSFGEVPADVTGQALKVQSVEVPGEPERRFPIRIYADQGTVVLPPSDNRNAVALVHPVYPEYLSPQIKRLLTERQELPRSLPNMAVNWVLLGGQQEARPLRQTQPYAEWRGPTGDAVALRAEWRRGSIVVSGLPEHEPTGSGQVLIREQYFPGWRASTNDGWIDAEASVEGFLQVAAPSGGALRFVFSERRWDRALGWLVSALSWGLLGLVLWRSR